VFAEEQICGPNRPLRAGLTNIVDVDTAPFNVLPSLALARRKAGMQQQLN
jgi:hypothetical protein